MYRIPRTQMTNRPAAIDSPNHNILLLISECSQFDEDAASCQNVRSSSSRNLTAAKIFMKIIRYQSPTGEVGFAQQHADGAFTKLRGTLFEKLEATSEPASVAKVLAPLEPIAILCIGLNYRQHAAEA